MSDLRAVILDGYVDEPACFGVPPYISPYIRTAAGVLYEHGCSADYITIDQLRKDPASIINLRNYDIVVMISGVTVPGKYLSGTPANITELQQIGFTLKGRTVSLLGGPIGFGYSSCGGEKAVKTAISGWTSALLGEPSSALDSYLNGDEPQGILSYADYNRWAVMGADIIKKHPFYPNVMIELETSRGCPRAVSGGCSFCTEPFYGMPKFRDVSSISEEVRVLRKAGAMNFRVGRQSDLLSYQSAGCEFPKPNADIIRKLFSEIRNAASDLKTLHIDNVNPGTIAHNPEASKDALEAIVEYHTAGDIAAFGVESVDPKVIAMNNLKGSAEDIFRAVEIVNEAGAERNNGIPELLPGLNFISGLAGETPKTFDMNYEFLMKILNSGLLVRRVNLRQLMPFEGTRAYENNTLGKYDKEFKAFKEKVRADFDMPMLEKVFPIGTVFRDVIIEKSGALSFGRQMGTYPVLVGIPQKINFGCKADAVVLSYGCRSVTALKTPILINKLSVSELKWIPGISKKQAHDIILKRPFADAESFAEKIGFSDENNIIQFMEF